MNLDEKTELINNMSENQNDENIINQKDKDKEDKNREDKKNEQDYKSKEDDKSEEDIKSEENDKSEEDNISDKDNISEEDNIAVKENQNKLKKNLQDYNNEYEKDINRIDEIDLYEDDSNINVDRLKNMLKQKSVNYKKNFYLNHIQKKINVLSYKIRFINHKYTDYLLYYKHFNVLVILFSSILTLFEAFTNMINIEEIENDALRLNLKFIPIIISTIVSLLATYIKFQKYQEKMEELSLTEEKSKLAISKLKNIREYLTIKEEINFNYIEELYFNEIYRYYNDVSVKISIMLDDNDYNKYSKKINQNDIKKEAIIIKKNKELHDIVEKQTSLIDTLNKSNKDLMKNENTELINELKTTMDDCNKYIGESYKNNEKHQGLCAQSPK